MNNTKNTKGMFYYGKELLKKLQDDFDDAAKAKEQQYIYVNSTGKYKSKNPGKQSLLAVFRDWYNGYQWDYTVHGEQIKTDKRIALPVINYIKTIIDHEIAMFKKSKPAFYVSPVESDDIERAQQADSVLRYFWKKRNMSYKVSLLAKDSKIYGTAFAKVVWDMTIDDVNVAILNPLNVYPDEYGAEIKDLRYIIVTYLKPKEYIERKYNTKLKNKKSVILYESWYNKGIIGEDGYCILWTNDEILEVKALSKMTNNAEIPIVAIRNKPTANEFWGTSQVQELGDLQLLHNKTIGLILDALIINNSGRIMTTDDQLEVTNDPSEIIHHNPGTEVTVIPPVPVNNALFELVGMSGYGAAQQLSDIYSMEAMSRHRTATGLMALQGESNTEADAYTEIVNNEVSKLGKFVLEFMLRGYKEKDFKKILGDKDVSKLRETKDWDIEINMGTDLPQDRASKINLFMQMLQLKIITPDIFLKMLNIPELNAVLQDAAKQNDQIKQMIESVKAQQGQGQESQEQAQEPTQIQDIPVEGGDESSNEK